MPACGAGADLVGPGRHCDVSDHRATVSIRRALPGLAGEHDLDHLSGLQAAHSHGRGHAGQRNAGQIESEFAGPGLQGTGGEQDESNQASDIFLLLIGNGNVVFGVTGRASVLLAQA